MIVNVRELVNGRDVLAGRTLGRKALGKLVSNMSNPPVPEICLLDFRSAALATGSFLAEFVLGFSRHARATLLNVYPVTAIVDEISLQEIEFVAESTNEIIPVCEGEKHGRLKGLRLVGALDPGQLETMQRIAQLGRASAKDLAASTKQSKIGLTAWHNRLVTLNRKGLIIEESDGRQKLYRALSQGV